MKEAALMHIGETTQYLMDHFLDFGDRKSFPMSLRYNLIQIAVTVLENEGQCAVGLAEYLQQFDNVWVRIELLEGLHDGWKEAKYLDFPESQTVFPAVILFLHLFYGNFVARGLGRGHEYRAKATIS